MEPVVESAVGEEAGHPSFLVDEDVLLVILERHGDDLAGVVDGEGSDEVGGRGVLAEDLDVPGDR